MRNSYFLFGTKSMSNHCDILDACGVKRLVVGVSAILFLLLASCNQKSTAPKNNSDAHRDSTVQTLTIAEEPYGQNKEWLAFKKNNGMYALHLKPSQNVRSKKYELKCEFFSEGKKGGETLLNYDKLGSVADGLADDSLLHFYAFPFADTAFKFVYNATPQYALMILLPLLKTERETYKWIHLSKSNSFELRDQIWMPIFALTQPYMETCTPEKCYYCVLPDNVGHYNDWGTTMGIKQYYIFSIRVL